MYYRNELLVEEKIPPYISNFLVWELAQASINLTSFLNSAPEWALFKTQRWSPNFMWCKFSSDDGEMAREKLPCYFTKNF